jgi:adenine-specific DNA-methyltransferase
MLSADKTKAKSSKQNPSHEKSVAHSTVEVADYRYKDEKRKNIPDAGLAIYNYKPQEPVKYSYDPHLDPQLIWTGKSERPSFEVETVSLHIHERVSTQAILKSVQKTGQLRQARLFADPDLPLDRRIEFYRHEMDWTNRLILGDSLLVMNSLKERELMDGKVQTIYMDPPYGIAYNSNFQPFVTRRDVKDGQDESLTREPEQVKAYRDSWQLGIHSYLTYLRDRLLLAKELLHNSGSIFVQINDENSHFVRALMDEVFQRENFVSIIAFRKSAARSALFLDNTVDYLLWYAKSKENLKYHQVYLPKTETAVSEQYDLVEFPDGTIHRAGTAKDVQGQKRVMAGELLSPGASKAGVFDFEFEGTKYAPYPGYHWKTTKDGLERLRSANRLIVAGNWLKYKRYMDDFAVVPVTDVWLDTVSSTFSQEDRRLFVVQTAMRVIERCILMTTDPGDLVFDPTCGSGTTAYCAEKWGRRWITCDTSRVALAIARQRLLTAKFAYHKLADPDKGVSSGFVYETVPHVTLGSIAQNETPQSEVLVDKPIIEEGIVRVSGPFTVEAIPAPAMQERLFKPTQPGPEIVGDYMELALDLLRKSGVTFPGGKHMNIENLRPIASAGFVHAEGEASQNGGKIRVAISFGPRYGPITAKQVDEAIRSSYRMQFDVLIFAGFAFDTEAQAVIQKNPIPKVSVQMAHISPDVIVGAYSNHPLLKTTKSSQIFTVFGEPDVKLERNKEEFKVRLLGVDLYDPTTGEVHSSIASDIPAWFLDEDYDGYTFKICQAFFPKEATAKNPWDRLENALRGVVDKEKMEAFRGTESLPFRAGEQKQIAVKVIDIRGNEVMVVKSLNGKETT